VCSISQGGYSDLKILLSCYNSLKLTASLPLEKWWLGDDFPLGDGACFRGRLLARGTRQDEDIKGHRHHDSKVVLDISSMYIRTFYG